MRSLLPDTDPFRVWTNFEFTDGGRIHEADALAITPKGVFLIEIKSWSGRVHGDQGTWVQERRDGSRLSYGNPARLNMAKVRSLASLIKRNWRGGPAAPRSPFIESLVWFSNPNLRVALPTELRGQVAVADDNEEAGHVQTLSQAIIDIGEAESARTGFRRITAEQSAEFAATMARIGFKESTRTRTAGPTCSSCRPSPSGQHPGLQRQAQAARAPGPGAHLFDGGGVDARRGKGAA